MNSQSLYPHIPRPDNPNALAYTLIREKGRFGKNNFKLMLNDSPILYSVTEKLKKGLIHVISENPIPKIHCEGYLGFVRVEQHGTQFTLVHPNPQGNENIIYDSEIMGIAYVNSNEAGFSVRQMRIIMSKDENPYFPLTDNAKLATIAQTNSNPSKVGDFFIFKTKLPIKKPDGNLSLHFGNVYVVSSVKNFIIYNQDESKCLYKIYKRSENAFSMRIDSPFNPLTAFSLGIAATNGFK